ncbi:excisionase [Rhizobium calliandrae]|uniref:Excisionase n=1 Tax=Rhizobium calliandrae TaxID=1312182 RepID=A0ABT7KMS8_9HYPH|nr:excisionase [Rhizobium calliandrae]MDL2409947.1 excisionase [Rhizobium calliandrae]
MLPTPANDNIQPDDPVRLAEIIPVAFPHGGMTVSGLRREAGRGRLVIMRIAGKDFTTLRSIEEMKQACRVPANQPGYGSAPGAKTVLPSGSFSTTESSSAQAAVRMIIAELKGPSPNTSPANSLQRRPGRTEQHQK